MTTEKDATTTSKQRLIEKPREPRQELPSPTVRGKTESLQASLPKPGKAETHETQNWQA